MKRILSISTLLLTVFCANSQEISDALRYAQTNQTGTARFRAMGGAFGALGGDLSAIMINPAGSSVFVNNYVSVTGSGFGIRNKSNYFGTNTNESVSSFDINQGGGIFVFDNKEEKSNWKKFAIGLNYENMGNFENNTFSSGINPLHTATQYFVNYANGLTTVSLQDLFYDQFDFGGQQASLAYQTFLINPATTNLNNTLFFANTPATNNFYQESETVSSGYNGKVAFNTSAQYTNFLTIGINLNAHFTDFRKTTTFYEDYIGATNANPTQGIQSFRFNNDLYTYGGGFSFQLGAIAKITKDFRAGLAYESPTWMRLTDELTQNLTTVCADCPQNNYFENPGITNVYQPYKLQTPSKFTGSLAYIFGKKGLISFDYATKDYSNTQFNSTGFTGLNGQMNTVLQRTNEYRFGAEQRYKQWSFRGGYRFEESPYKDKNIMGNLNSFSGGLGYSLGNTKIDMAYTFAKRNTSEQFFNVGMTDRAFINSINNSVTVTVGFEL